MYVCDCQVECAFFRILFFRSKTEKNIFFSAEKTEKPKKSQKPKKPKKSQKPKKPKNNCSENRKTVEKTEKSEKKISIDSFYWKEPLLHMTALKNSLSKTPSRADLSLNLVLLLVTKVLDMLNTTRYRCWWQIKRNVVQLLIFCPFPAFFVSCHFQT